MNRFCQNLILPFRRKLDLRDFRQFKKIEDDYGNNVENGQYTIKFFNLMGGDCVGYITYRVAVGQVGLFVLQPEYRNRGLGKQILIQTINHMKEHEMTHIWAVTSENHEFWSNVFHKGFTWHENRVHPSVTGGGYRMKI